MRKLVECILLLSLSVSIACGQSTNGLIASYSFSGNANDNSGYYNNGSVAGAVLSLDRFGAVNSAYSFDGTNDVITVSNASSLNLTTGITAEAWIKMDQPVLDYWQTILVKGGSGERNYELSIAYTNRMIWNYMTGGASKWLLTSQSGIIDGKWHHVVGTWDGATAKLYIDGICESQSSWAQALVPNSSALSIGYCPGYSSHTYFNGSIDDVKLYNRALSASEIANNYQGLVLWNKLGSQYEVEHSEVGLSGVYSNGLFTNGVFGSAYAANNVQQQGVWFPKEVIPVESGCLELWAKLEGFPASISGGGWKPGFVQIWDGGINGYAFGFNANMGGGQGGICGSAGPAFQCGTGAFGTWSYESVLGVGQAEAWHHYALVWAKNCIQGVPDGTRRIAIYLDGQLNSTVWYDTYPTNTPYSPLTNDVLHLVLNSLSQGITCIDNLKIWSYAKTNFVDRFGEGVGGDSNSVSFTVSGSPSAYGTPQPYGYGNKWVTKGTVVTNYVVSPVSGGTGVNYVCTGWTGSGDVTSGSGTNVTVTINTNSTLTWQWRTDYYLDTSAGSGGGVDIGDGWYTNGAVVTITATPTNEYRFLLWSGDVPSGMVNNNPLVVTMDKARTISAVFAFGTNNPFVAWYPFYGNADDASGNGHTGVIYGATLAVDRFGNSSSAYSFDGTNDYIQVASVSDLNLTTALTVMAWVRATAPGDGSGWDGIVCKGDAADRNYMLGRYGVNALSIYMTGGQGKWMLRGKKNICDGQWHLVATTWDGSRVYLYVDGEDDADYTSIDTYGYNWNQPLVVNSLPLLIGKISDTYAYSYFNNGNIDEVKIYNRALTVQEVQQAYNDNGLVLWNKLGSQYEVEHSEVGLSGIVTNGGFTNGVFGGCYVANYDQDLGIEFSRDVIPFEVGCVEFWAKIEGYPSSISGGGEKPYFLEMGDGSTAWTIGFNANNGSSIGGLCGETGPHYYLGTGAYGTWSYESILGVGQADTWHHYALVWNKDSIPGVSDGTKKVAIYLDGQLNSASWAHTGTNSVFIPLTNGAFRLAHNSLTQGMTYMDNLKIWSYAKTNFADRFGEGVGIDSNAVSFTVNGSPSAYGTPQPYGYGNEWVTKGTVVTNYMVSPVSGSTGIMYVCTGWTGSGDVTSGSGTNVTVTINTNSTLTWQWRTDYYLDTTAGSGGSVDVGDGWYTNGTVVTVTATPTNGYRFLLWSGDVPSGMANNNPLVITMDKVRTISAVFASGTNNSLVASYSFSGNANDSSGYYNNGSVAGAILSLDRFGTTSSAYSFDGTNDVITVPNASSLNLTTGVTAEAWIKTDQTIYPNWRTIMVKGGGSERNYELSIAYTNKMVWNYMTGGESKWLLTSQSGITDDRWHYVVGTWDGATAKLYIDGVCESQSSWSQALVPNSSTLSIGYCPGYSYTYFNGSIDDVKLYNKALSASEIANNYQGLVFWNKLGSQYEVEHSEVGLSGVYSNGLFTNGVFGGAYAANNVQQQGVWFPKEVIPVESGCLELWAKLEGFPTSISGGGWKPGFVQIWDGGINGYAFGFNANMGGGQGGVCASAGPAFQCGTGAFGTWSYESVLGVGQAEAWHHYALVWAKNCIQGVPDGTRRVAVYLDGQLNPTIWYDTYPTNTPYSPLTNDVLHLVLNSLSQGVTCIDNLKIWSYAKTNFADRFGEGVGGDSNSVSFTVSGSPSAYGTPQPYGYGNKWVTKGTVVTNYMVSPVSGSAGIMYVCTGWTGSGDVTSGSGTNVTVTINTNSTLTWQWRTDYYLDTTAGSGGGVDIGDGWYTNGAVVTITATPTNGYRFLLWSGDVPSGMGTNNPLAVTMSTTRTISAIFASANAPTNGLVFWNKLGSQYDVEHSEVGLSGVYSNGLFTNGVFGGAYAANNVQQQGVWFPKEVIPVESGCLELWAKLEGFPTSISGGGWKPGFVQIWDGGINGYAFGFNANMGGGQGGVCASAGPAFQCGTGAFGTWSYESVLGVGQAEAWHHYALVWAKNCIPGVSNGTRRVAVYLDGQLNPTIWYDTYPTNTPYSPLTNDVLHLVLNSLSQGVTCIDNLKIWSYAKTNFADRFEEGVAAESNTVLFAVWGSPEAYGIPLPYGYATNVLSKGTVVSNTVASPVSGGAGVRYTCTGWTGSGDVTSGSGTNVTVTINTNSTLAWQWRTDYYLDTTAGSGGSVDVGDGWYTNGALVTVTAISSNGWRFVQWSGAVVSSNNPIAVTMNQAQSITASFDMNTCVVAGQVFYTGSQSGTIYVEAFGDVDYSDKIGFAGISTPGVYVITLLPVGRNYWIRAYRDYNGNSSLDPTEPAGTYCLNPVTNLLYSRGGIDITLQRLSAPQGLKASGSASCIVLSWDANQESGVVGYNVYRFDNELARFDKLNGAPVPETSYVDRFITTGKDYYYYISAVIKSEYFSSYMESPASGIVGATAGTVTLWMPDYFGPTSSVVRLRINTSDARGVLGNDMQITVSYDPSILIPISLVSTNLTVEKTVLTESLVVSNSISSGQVYVDVTTNMTSDTAPSPLVVSASSELNGTYAAWRCFDGVTNDVNPWLNDGGLPAGVGWIKYDWGTNVTQTITKYEVWGMNDPVNMNNPKHWYVWGSNCGGSEVLLGSATDQTGWVAAECRSYTLTNSGAYRYYRFDVIINNGGAYCGCHEIRWYATHTNGNPGTVTIYASGAASSSNNAKLNILGCAYESAPHDPAPLTAYFSTNGGLIWHNINDGRNINDGKSYSVDIGSIPNATNCLIWIHDSRNGRDRKSNEIGDHVKLLRNGDNLGAVSRYNQQEVHPCVGKYIDRNLETHVGLDDAVYMFEFADSTNELSSFQDVVAYIEYNKGASLIGEGRLFDVVFAVKNTAVPGTKCTNEFVSVSLKDCNGTPLAVESSDKAVFTVQSTFILGDINGDGTVTVSGDFTLAMRMANGQLIPTEDQLKAGDIDGDGKITKIDATLIQRIALGKKINPDGGGSGGSGGGGEPAVAGYQLSIGTFEAEPGSVVQVPVEIDNAKNIACLDLRINYDSQRLTLQSVTNAALTSSFVVEYAVGSDCVDIVMSSPDDLLSGSGIVLYLNFLVASTPDYGAMIPVTISKKGLGTQYGADLSWSSGITVSNGVIKTKEPGRVDSDGDGIPDVSIHSTESRPSGSEGFKLKWNSQVGRLYDIECSTNLIQGFFMMQNDLVGSDTEKEFTDTNTTGPEPKYYRIKIH